MVHIAAGLASMLTRRVPYFRQLRESTPQLMQLYAAAAAVGIASAVRSPIGGLLFSVEVTSVSYEVSGYLKAFFAVVCGTIFVYFVDGSRFYYAVTDLTLNQFQRQDMLAFLAIGVIGGLMGGCFVHMQRLMYEFRNKPKNKWMMVEWPAYFDLTGMTVVVITGIVAFTTGEFLRLPMAQTIQDLVRNVTLDQTGANENATAGLDFKLNAHDWGNDGHLLLNLAGYCFWIYVLASVSTVLTFPAGLFVPSMAIGAR